MVDTYFEISRLLSRQMAYIVYCLSFAIGRCSTETEGKFPQGSSKKFVYLSFVKVFLKVKDLNFFCDIQLKS